MGLPKKKAAPGKNPPDELDAAFFDSCKIIQPGVITTSMIATVVETRLSKDAGFTPRPSVYLLTCITSSGGFNKSDDGEKPIPITGGGGSLAASRIASPDKTAAGHASFILALFCTAGGGGGGGGARKRAQK